jgi:hypothetical protein
MKGFGALQEYEASFRRRVFIRLLELTKQKDPILSRIPTIEMPVATTRNTLPSGEVVEQAPFEVPGTLRFEKAVCVSGDLAKFSAELDRCADEMVWYAPGAPSGPFGMLERMTWSASSPEIVVHS